jgi:hypothetical protein
MKISRKLSDAYTDGWFVRHKGEARITDLHGKELTAWQLGYSDCERGSINPLYVLGPDKIDGKKRK